MVDGPQRASYLLDIRTSFRSFCRIPDRTESAHSIPTINIQFQGTVNPRTFTTAFNGMFASLATSFTLTMGGNFMLLFFGLTLFNQRHHGLSDSKRQQRKEAQVQSTKCGINGRGKSVTASDSVAVHVPGIINLMHSN